MDIETKLQFLDGRIDCMLNALESMVKKTEGFGLRLAALEDRCNVERVPLKKVRLTFGDALVFLKEGRKLTRKCWQNKGVYIYKKSNCNEIRVFTIRLIDCAWMPNHDELLASDWEVVE